MDATLVIETEQGREVRPFATPSITFGRSKTCDVVLADPAISSHHIRIARQGRAFVMRDLESRNATFVNGERTSERILQRGDRITIGKTKIEFHLGEVPPTLPTVRPARRRSFWLKGQDPAQPRSNARVFLSALLATPPVLLSVGIHAVVLVLLMTVYIYVAVPRMKDRDASFQVSMRPNLTLADLREARDDGKREGNEDSDPFTAPHVAPRPEAPVFDEAAAPAVRPGQAELPNLPPVMARGSDVMAVRLPKIAGGSPTGTANATVPPQGGKIDIAQGADIAGIVLGRLRGRPGDWDTYGTLKKDNIVVITGIYDHVEDVLDALMVPHAAVTPRKFDALKLEPACAILVDCPGYLNGSEVRRIRQWVSDGGYLFTTDWTLGVLSQMFPGMVRRGGTQTAEDWVTVAPAKGLEDHPLLKDVFSPLKGHPLWWLEEGTYPIDVQDPLKVRVLIDSGEMKRRYGEGAVAVTFDYGKGKVLHVASHFYQVSTDMKTHYSMTQLIVNFLLQAKQSHDDR